MAKSNYILQHMHIDRRLISIRNDGMCVQPGKHSAAVEKVFAEMTYVDFNRLTQRYEPLRRCTAPLLERQSNTTTLVFRVKRCTEADLPGGKLQIHDDAALELPTQQWDICHEPLDGLDEFYDTAIAPHVVAGGKPALITGAAGTGKSHILAPPRDRLEGTWGTLCINFP